jgi:ATP-binding cassette subfamily G (WHITE) protein 2
MKRSFSEAHLPSGRGVLVSFRDVVYSVQDSNDRKKRISLLDGVSGYIRPKELMALMGPSGSGKTTLLDVLAGRKTVGTTQGQIKFGGLAPTSEYLRRYTGYVEQFDTLVPILTVSEMFLYTALLKLEREVDVEKKEEAVERVIDVLGLETCRNVLIGSSTNRGISGGQAKRVNIGIALISNPRVLFLDEPTTGLDSFTSNEVVSVIKDLAMSGITVCATIHSPSEYAFKLFDKMLILLRGKTVYFGNNCDTVTYLKQSCESFEKSFLDLHVASESEWITDVVMTADRAGYGELLVQSYAESDKYAHAMSELDVQLERTNSLSADYLKELSVKRATTTPSWYGLLVLMRFRLLRNYSTSVFYASHVAPWLIQTLIMFSTFWFVADNMTPYTVTNVTGIIFFWSVTPAFGAASYIPAIMLSRPLFFRERNDGLYRSITFLIYLLTEEVLIAIPVTLLINMAMWFGLKLAGSFVLWWISFLVTYITGITVSYAICSVSPSIDVANAAVPIFGVICMFFSGFLIRMESIGWYWRWLVYLTPTYYSFGAQMRNFFSGERNFPYLGSSSVTSYYGLDWLSAWEFVAMQCIFVVVFFCMAWVGITKYKPVSR